VAKKYISIEGEGANRVVRDHASKKEAHAYGASLRTQGKVAFVHSAADAEKHGLDPRKKAGMAKKASTWAKAGASIAGKSGRKPTRGESAAKSRDSSFMEAGEAARHKAEAARASASRGRTTLNLQPVGHVTGSTPVSVNIKQVRSLGNRGRADRGPAVDRAVQAGKNLASSASAAQNLAGRAVHDKFKQHVQADSKVINKALHRTAGSAGSGRISPPYIPKHTPGTPTEKVRPTSGPKSHLATAAVRAQGQLGRKHDSAGGVQGSYTAKRPPARKKLNLHTQEGSSGITKKPSSFHPSEAATAKTTKHRHTLQRGKKGGTFYMVNGRKIYAKK